MPLSPQQVRDARPDHLAKQVDGLVGSIDAMLLERFDGSPVELAVQPSGPDAAEIQRRVFAIYEAKGWDCRGRPRGWVFRPKGADPDEARELGSRFMSHESSPGPIP